MFDVVRKLMMARSLNMENGEITLFHKRVQLVPVEIFVDMLHSKNNLNNIAISEYEAAKSSTLDYFRFLRDKKGIKGNELVKWCQNIFNLAGWGRVSFNVSEIPEGRGSVKIENSAFASTYLQKYGKSKTPACHLVRGGIAGGGIVLTEKEDLEAVEVNCMAMGAPVCTIIYKPRDEFVKDYEERGSNIIKTQLNL